MRFAYQYKYPIVKMVATISPAIRQYNPSTKVVPAALEAMTTEKGLTVENVLPIELARKIDPTYNRVIAHRYKDRYQH